MKRYVLLLWTIVVAELLLLHSESVILCHAVCNVYSVILCYTIYSVYCATQYIVHKWTSKPTPHWQSCLLASSVILGTDSF